MKELIKLINTIKKKKTKKKVCFFLGNTKKKESTKFFFTPIRESRNFIFFGAIVYSDFIAKKILKIIDGKVDIVMVDIEKKVQSKNKKISLVNIERSAKDVIKKSKLYIYKANDLAINATETLLFNLFLKDKRGLGGKKILIIGIGNIGFKLSIKFVESGSKIYIWTRKKELLPNFAKTINTIKPQGTTSMVKALKNMPKNLDFFDIIISTADSKNIIKKDIVKNLKKKNIFIDVGKGNFDKNAIKILNEKKINIYRLDTTNSYFSYLENISLTEKQYNYSKFKNKLKNITFVLRGIVGQKNDIVVDDVVNPKKIFGICDGEGGFIRHNFGEKKKILNNIKATIKRRPSYD
jgi:hypothetical protein